MVDLRPVSSVVVGVHPSRFFAREISGGLRFGSSCGRGRRAIALLLSGIISRTFCASALIVRSSGLPRLTGPTNPSSLFIRRNACPRRNARAGQSHLRGPGSLRSEGEPRDHRTPRSWTPVECERACAPIQCDHMQRAATRTTAGRVVEIKSSVGASAESQPTRASTDRKLRICTTSECVYLSIFSRISDAGVRQRRLDARSLRTSVALTGGGRIYWPTFCRG